MKITLYKFLALPDQEQYEIILIQGDYIDLRFEENKRFVLYAVDLFFVEAEYDSEENKVIGKRALLQEGYWISNLSFKKLDFNNIM